MVPSEANIRLEKGQRRHRTVVQDQQRHTCGFEKTLTTAVRVTNAWPEPQRPAPRMIVGAARRLQSAQRDATGGVRLRRSCRRVPGVGAAPGAAPGVVLGAAGRAHAVVAGDSLGALARAGRWWEALHAFASRPAGAPADIVGCSLLAAACGRAGRWQHALGLLQTLRERGAEPDEVACTVLLSACRGASAWRPALALLSEMEGGACGPRPGLRHYSAAIGVCEFAGQWPQALALWGRMKERRLAPNVRCCGALVSACEKGKEWQRALLLLFGMEQWRVAPDVMSFTAAMSACGKARHLRHALALRASMRARELRPTAASYGALISACERIRHWEIALELLEEMRRGAVAPDEVVFNASISACESGAQWAQALALLAASQAAFPRGADQGLNAAVSACSKGWEWERALQLLAADVPASHGTMPRAVCLGSVLLHMEGRHWRAALSLLGRLPSRAQAPDLAALRGAATTCQEAAQPAALAALLSPWARLLSSVCRAPSGPRAAPEEAMEAALAASWLRAARRLPEGLERALARRHEVPAASGLRLGDGARDGLIEAAGAAGGAFARQHLEAAGAGIGTARATPRDVRKGRAVEPRAGDARRTNVVSERGPRRKARGHTSEIPHKQRRHNRGLLRVGSVRFAYGLGALQFARCVRKHRYARQTCI